MSREIDCSNTAYIYEFDGELAREAARIKAAPATDKEAFALRVARQEHESLSRARELAKQVADKLREACSDMEPMLDVARRVGSCFAAGEIDVYERGKRVRPTQGCGLPKLCPIHARHETKRRLTRYEQVIQDTAKRYRIQAITLTVRNARRGELAKTIRHIWESWALLRQTQVWSGVVAATCQMEITWAIHEQTYHPHLHVLAAIRWGHDFDWTQLQRAWEMVSGSPGVHIRAVAGDAQAILAAIKEHIKYVSKFRKDDQEPGHGGMLDMPSWAFREWLECIWGRRFLRTYGKWYNIPEVELTEADLGEYYGTCRWGPDLGPGVFLIRVNISLRHLAGKLELMPEDLAHWVA